MFDGDPLHRAGDQDGSTLDGHDQEMGGEVAPVIEAGQPEHGLGSGEHGTREPPPGESRPHLDLPVFDFALAERISVHLALMCTT